MDYKAFPILLIENQQIQYEKIYEKLIDFTVFPAKEEYNALMERVRIVVNFMYLKSRRDTAFEWIVEYAKKKGIQLLIIDYKLSGTYKGKSGLFLAQELIEHKKLKKLKTLYLSRTPYNAEELMAERVKHFNADDWIEKGYSGMNILDDIYFKTHVVDAIQKKIQQIVDESERVKGERELQVEQWITALDSGPSIRNYVYREFNELLALQRTEKIEVFIEGLYNLEFSKHKELPGKGAFLQAFEQFEKENNIKL